MKKLGLAIWILLSCIVVKAETQVEKDSIISIFEPLDINLPESHSVLDAQYSPSGDRMFILAADLSFEDYWEKDYLLIIRKQKGPYRMLPRFVRGILPAMVELKIAGEIRVTIPKNKTRPDFGICWTERP